MRIAQNKKKSREKYPPKMLDVHAAPSARGATAAMAVLTVINLLNYIDRCCSGRTSALAGCDRRSL
jgi:hypothetical protein